MNLPLLRALTCSLVLAASAGAVRAATPVIGAQLFQDTNARIDDLFLIRANPPKPPGPQDNPFRANDAPPQPAPTSTGEPAPNAVHETPDETLLRLAYSSLSFGGLLMSDDRPMVVINKAIYKEGGLLTVRVQGNMEYLRIVTLTTDSITLGLREARLTLNF